MEAIKETLPEIMGMILGATVEFSGRLQSLKDPVCPSCGLSRSEYKKAARLGCAQCYETFVKDLDGLVTTCIASRAIPENHRNTRSPPFMSLCSCDSCATQRKKPDRLTQRN